MVHALPCEPCLTEWRALMPENPVQWRSQEDWVRLFERAELKVSRWQSWTYPAHFESAMAMVRSFHLSGVTGRVQVGASRLRQAMRQYDAKHHNSRGVTATWCWLAIEAR